MRLVELVDVVSENFTPGTTTKLGLGYEVLRKYNPRLIYAACSGFGQTGSYSSKPALDTVAQAMSGMISITGPESGPPVRVGISLADAVSSIFLAFGILAALEERRKSNQGQMVDVAMVDSLVSIMENPFMRYFATGEVPKRVGHRHPIAAIHQIFPTKDGYIAIVASGEVEQWVTFLEVVGRLDLLSDERYHNSGTRRKYLDEFEPIISEALKAKTTAEWQKEFEAVGIPCGPVNDISQAARDPQLLHRDMFIDIPCSGVKSGSLRVCNSPMNFHSCK